MTRQTIALRRLDATFTCTQRTRTLSIEERRQHHKDGGGPIEAVPLHAAVVIDNKTGAVIADAESSSETDAVEKAIAKACVLRGISLDSVDPAKALEQRVASLEQEVALLKSLVVSKATPLDSAPEAPLTSASSDGVAPKEGRPDAPTSRARGK